MRFFASYLILLAFLVNTLVPVPLALAQEIFLPAPGVRVSLSPEFNPPVIKGIKVYPDHPLRFDFILDRGDSLPSDGMPGDMKQEAAKLIKYFLAGLTIPEKDLWVNLSPYEKDRIVPETFGLTEMGRDLLAEDYILKQITASLIYPENETGKKFWGRVYAQAARTFGTTDVPVNTFNKVWIVPEKAVVFENAKAGTAYVIESRLKVMLEQDYLSLEKHAALGVKKSGGENHAQTMSGLGQQIIKDIVIPELTREVNQDKNFAKLRQVYNSLILATWYKKKIKDSILAQVYADKNKISGVGYSGSRAYDIEGIYQRYLQAFKKGVYNYIKEETDPATQQIIPRKYFSGGVVMQFGAGTDDAMVTVHDASAAQLASKTGMVQVTADLAMINEPNLGFGTFGRQRMTAGLRQELKQLLSQVNLTVPALPDMIGMKKGQEALVIADKILEENHGIGIVIGSTSVDLHNSKADNQQLEKHSDLDVLVLTPGFTLKDKFQGGIDWWVPKTVKLKIQSSYYPTGVLEKNIYVNGAGIYLRADVVNHGDLNGLKPGLYMTDREFLKDLTESVVFSRAGGSMSSQVADAFAAALDKLIRNSISPVWTQLFGKQRIIRDLGVRDIDEELTAAIDRYTVYRDVGDRTGDTGESSQSANTIPLKEFIKDIIISNEFMEKELIKVDFDFGNSLNLYLKDPTEYNEVKNRMDEILTELIPNAIQAQKEGGLKIVVQNNKISIKNKGKIDWQDIRRRYHGLIDENKLYISFKGDGSIGEFVHKDHLSQEFIDPQRYRLAAYEDVDDLFATSAGLKKLFFDRIGISFAKIKVMERPNNAGVGIFLSKEYVKLLGGQLQLADDGEKSGEVSFEMEFSEKSPFTIEDRSLKKADSAQLSDRAMRGSQNSLEDEAWSRGRSARSGRGGTNLDALGHNTRTERIAGDWKDLEAHVDQERRSRPHSTEEDIIEHLFDNAMSSPSLSGAQLSQNGGIDLTSANMNLQTRLASPVDGTADGGIKFRLDPAMLAQLQNAPGFVPVISRIHPITDLQTFLGLQAAPK
jgi:hypothetical protein